MKTKTITLDENQLMTLTNALSIASSQINTFSNLKEDLKVEQIKKIDLLIELIQKNNFDQKEILSLKAEEIKI